MYSWASKKGAAAAPVCELQRLYAGDSNLYDYVPGAAVRVYTYPFQQPL